MPAYSSACHHLACCFNLNLCSLQNRSSFGKGFLQDNRMNKLKQLSLVGACSSEQGTALFGKTCRVFRIKKVLEDPKCGILYSKEFPLLCSCSTALFCYTSPLEAHRLAFISISLPVNELTVLLRKSVACSKWWLCVWTKKMVWYFFSLQISVQVSLPK